MGTVNYSYCLNSPTGSMKKGGPTPDFNVEANTPSVSKCVAQITRSRPCVVRWLAWSRFRWSVPFPRPQPFAQLTAGEVVGKPQHEIPPQSDSSIHKDQPLSHKEIPPRIGLSQHHVHHDIREPERYISIFPFWPP